jgi:hypothetical protein
LSAALAAVLSVGLSVALAAGLLGSAVLAGRSAGSGPVLHDSNAGRGRYFPTVLYDAGSVRTTAEFQTGYNNVAVIVRYQSSICCIAMPPAAVGQKCPYARQPGSRAAFDAAHLEAGRSISRLALTSAALASEPLLRASALAPPPPDSRVAAPASSALADRKTCHLSFL